MSKGQAEIVEEQFSYDGWLVFNQIFKTEPLDRGIEPSGIIDRFPTYEGGSPSDDDSGFEKSKFAEYLARIPELTDELEMFAQDLHAFHYVDEDWVQEFGYDENGEEKIYYQPYHDEVDIFWDFDRQVMMLRGDKDLLERKADDLRGGLSGELKLESVDFDFDFFLWVLYKEYRGENLSSGLSVRKLTRCKTIGSHEDKLGKHGEVKGSENLLKSLMMIAPILDGKKVEGIQGEFILNKQILNAEIQYGGKVHVKVSDSPLKTMSDLRRMGLALRFLSELAELFKEWQNLDSDDQYPPPRFFDKLADEAEEQGWVPNFDPEAVKQEYRRKRQSPDKSAEGGSIPAEDAT